jgi:hypothetical protein
VVRTLDVGWDFVDDGFWFLVNPLLESVCNAVSRKSNRVEFSRGFMNLGGHVEVAEFVGDF